MFYSKIADCKNQYMHLRHLAHRHLWQRMPRELRRRGLFFLTSQLAPRPIREQRAAAPFIVVGFLRTSSGLGESARLCHDALAQRGYEVYGIDLTAKFEQTGPRVDFQFKDGRVLEGGGTLILHVNGPFVPLAMMCLGKRLIATKRIIGYWAWELADAPPEWRFGLPFVHEIWVPSRFTAAGIRQIAGKTRIRVVPHPVAARKRLTTTTRQKNVPFTVLVCFDMASSFARKNPLGAVKAFRMAFGNDITCRLLLRILNPNIYREGHAALLAEIDSAPNIEVKDDGSGGTDVGELYSSADAVLSLHRSEGFGLVLAEAMLHGLAVVATNWSGNVDFLTDKNGMPVSYTLVPAVDPQGTYDHPSSVWAEADIEDAAIKLRALRDDRKLCLTLGRRAAREAALGFGTACYGKLLKEAFNL